MINYSVDSPIRKTVIVILFVVSLFLLKPVNMVIMAIYGLIIEILPAAEKFFASLSTVGISLSGLSLLSLFAILYLLFCKFFWKMKPVASLTGIPNLNGIWEGKLVSSHKIPGTDTNVELDMTVEINQDWNSISIKSQFPKSSSYNKTASLHTNEQKGIVLGFSYRNDSMDVNVDSREYSGYNELTYKENTLEGVYFTNRNDGTYGTIKLKKRKQRVKNAHRHNYQ